MSQSENNLQAFLYTLMRDTVVPGEVEKLVQGHEAHPGPYRFSNVHLAAYALELARRVLKPATFVVEGPKVWLDPDGEPWELVERGDRGGMAELHLRRGDVHVVDFEASLIARDWRR